MSQHENNEQAFQMRVVEQLVKELQSELPRMMQDLRTQGAKAAIRSIRATSGHPRQNHGSYAQDCMAQERDAEAERVKALELEGRADGIRRINSTMFGAMGVKSEGAVLDGYMRNLQRHIEQQMKDVSSDIETAALDAVQYSSSHPDFGLVRAKAIKLDAVTDGMLEVLAVAQRLGGNLLTTACASAVLS
jgi:hypothetical protein